MSTPTPNSTTVLFTYSAAQSHIFFESAALGRFRFFPKGRRLGATRGGAHAFIEFMLEGWPCLWGDTTHANIKRYVERYFIPALKKNRIWYSWNAQDSCLKVGDKGGYTDFRSADRPENWEGFGYRVIFLNEAGIILDDEYLYTNAVLPMLMDFADSQLIAAGTPKLRQGVGRLFKELCDKAERGEPDHHMHRFTTYDNPFLRRSTVEALAAQISDLERPQEIGGQFVEPGGELVKREHLRYMARPDHEDKAALARDWIITMGVDLAISKKTTADYTACVVIGRERFGQQRTCVLDYSRCRGGFFKGVELWQSMAEKWAPQIIGIEAVQFQAAAVEYALVTTSLPVRPVTPDKDKVTRFTSISVRYEHAVIYHAHELKYSVFEDELLAFNGDGKGHDDMVDAEQIAHSLLPNAAPAIIGTTGARDSAPEKSAAILVSASGWGTVRNNSTMGGFAQ